jgi:hypothetical protein
VLINDSVDLIRGLVDRQTRAARRAHSKYVWKFFIDNALCPDGTSWFTSGHGNLGSSALEISTAKTAITALANMTEPGSGNKLGLNFADFAWHLVVPIDLWDTAKGANEMDSSYFTSNDLTTKTPNPISRLFGDHSERVVVCPYLSDTNDWGVLRDVEDVPMVEMSYLGGKEEPELIIEQGPTEEHCLVEDRIGYKMRFEFGGGLADYRGGYKSVV